MWLWSITLVTLTTFINQQQLGCVQKITKPTHELNENETQIWKIIYNNNRHCDYMCFKISVTVEGSQKTHTALINHLCFFFTQILLKVGE